MGKPGSSTQQTLEFVERYQALFNQDPQSRVFAPLAEGYRKLGFLKQAQDIATKGVAIHPAFASGHLALARIQMDLDLKDVAAESLEKAVELSPENLLAHRLLAQLQMERGQPKLALKAFKMLLFLNPRDETSAAQVKKLESLTAADFSEDIFKPAGLSVAGSLLGPASSPQALQARPNMTAHERQRHLERTISLVDALLVRSDFHRALQLIESAQQSVGAHPELKRRAHFISSRGQEPETTAGHQHSASQVTPSPLSETSARDAEVDPIIQKATRISRQIEKLETLLERVESRRI